MKRVIFVFIAVSTFCITGCREEKTAGEKVDERMEQTGEDIEEAADEVEDAADGN